MLFNQSLWGDVVLVTIFYKDFASSHISECGPVCIARCNGDVVMGHVNGGVWFHITTCNYYVVFGQGFNYVVSDK